MSGTTKVFSLQLVNGLLNYKTMTFHAGDMVEVRLTSDGQPVDFMFQEVTAAASTNGVFGTSIANDDQGGTYHLICKNQSCGSLTLTVIPKNATANTTANTNSSSQISKVELQRIPAGTTFNPQNTYETTTSFQLGDQFGMSITGAFSSGDKSTFSITDSDGTEVEPQGISSNLQNGSNGTCCFSLPDTAGSYNLNIYINSIKSQSVPITVE
jgi:hypothetical protein